MADPGTPKRSTSGWWASATSYVPYWSPSKNDPAPAGSTTTPAGTTQATASTAASTGNASTSNGTRRPAPLDANAMRAAQENERQAFVRKEIEARARRNPAIRPDATAFIEQLRVFEQRLGRPNAIIKEIIEEFFTPTEQRLLLPTDKVENNAMWHIQKGNTKRYNELRSEKGRFPRQEERQSRGDSNAERALKMTMVWFGVPVEPLRGVGFEIGGLGEFEEQEEEFLADLELKGIDPSVELAKEPPLKFLNYYQHRTWGTETDRSGATDLDIYYGIPELLPNETVASAATLEFMRKAELPIPMSLRGGGYDADDDSDDAMDVDYTPLHGSDEHDNSLLESDTSIASVTAPCLRGGGLPEENSDGHSDDGYDASSDSEASTSDAEMLDSAPVHLRGGTGGRPTASQKFPSVFTEDEKKTQEWVPLYGFQGKVHFDLWNAATFTDAVMRLLGIDNTPATTPHVWIHIYDQRSKSWLKPSKQHPVQIRWEDDDVIGARRVRIEFKKSASPALFATARGEEPPEHFEPADADCPALRVMKCFLDMQQADEQRGDVAYLRIPDNGWQLQQLNVFQPWWMTVARILAPGLHAGKAGYPAIAPYLFGIDADQVSYGGRSMFKGNWVDIINGFSENGYQPCILQPTLEGVIVLGTPDFEFSWLFQDFPTIAEAIEDQLVGEHVPVAYRPNLAEIQFWFKGDDIFDINKRRDAVHGWRTNGSGFVNPEHVNAEFEKREDEYRSEGVTPFVALHLRYEEYTLLTRLTPRPDPEDVEEERQTHTEAFNKSRLDRDDLATAARFRGVLAQLGFDVKKPVYIDFEREFRAADDEIQKHWKRATRNWMGDKDPEGFAEDENRKLRGTSEFRFGPRTTEDEWKLIERQINYPVLRVQPTNDSYGTEPESVYQQLETRPWGYRNVHDVIPLFDRGSVPPGRRTAKRAFASPEERPVVKRPPPPTQGTQTAPPKSKVKTKTQPDPITQPSTGLSRRGTPATSEPAQEPEADPTPATPDPRRSPSKTTAALNTGFTPEQEKIFADMELREPGSSAALRAAFSPMAARSNTGTDPNTSGNLTTTKGTETSTSSGTSGGTTGSTTGNTTGDTTGGKTAGGTGGTSGSTTGGRIGGTVNTEPLHPSMYQSRSLPEPYKPTGKAAEHPIKGALTTEESENLLEVVANLAEECHHAGMKSDDGVLQKLLPFPLPPVKKPDPEQEHRAEIDGIYTDDGTPTEINRRNARLRHESYARVLSIFDKGDRRPHIPIHAPSHESILRTGDGPPAVSLGLLTPTESARLNTQLHTLRYMALDRVEQCPYPHCELAFPRIDYKRMEKHIKDVHEIEKCNFCDDPLYTKWNQTQRQAHYLSKHPELFANYDKDKRDTFPGGEQGREYSKASSKYVHERESDWIFCSRCGRNHSELYSRVDRMHHDSVCFPNMREQPSRDGRVKGEFRFCEACGDFVDLRFYQNRDESGRPIGVPKMHNHVCSKEHDRRPCCNKCGLALRQFSQNYMALHRLHCRGVDNTRDTGPHVAAFCCHCGIDMGPTLRMAKDHLAGCKLKNTKQSFAGPIDENGKVLDSPLVDAARPVDPNDDGHDYTRLEQHRHIYNDKGAYPAECPLCGETLPHHTAGRLWTHYKNKHGDQKRWKLQCLYCDVPYARLGWATDQMVSHLDDHLNGKDTNIKRHMALSAIGHSGGKGGMGIPPTGGIANLAHGETWPQGEALFGSIGVQDAGRRANAYHSMKPADFERHSKELKAVGKRGEESPSEDPKAKKKKSSGGKNDPNKTPKHTKKQSNAKDESKKTKKPPAQPKGKGKGKNQPPPAESSEESDKSDSEPGPDPGAGKVATPQSGRGKHGKGKNDSTYHPRPGDDVDQDDLDDALEQSAAPDPNDIGESSTKSNNNKRSRSAEPADDESRKKPKPNESKESSPAVTSPKPASKTKSQKGAGKGAKPDPKPRATGAKRGAKSRTVSRAESVATSETEGASPGRTGTRPGLRPRRAANK